MHNEVIAILLIMTLYYISFLVIADSTLIVILGWLNFDYISFSIIVILCLLTGDRIKYIGPSVQVESDSR